MAESGFTTVRLEHRRGWARLTLNRPDKLNAINREMIDEVNAALDAVEQQQHRALLVTGAGRAFSAGQDLADPNLPTGPDADLGEVLERLYNPLVRRLRGLALPVVAAVGGIAAGAGANLALACDLVIAGRTARFIQAFAKLGLVPDAGGTWTLTQRLGEQRAMGLALTGEALSGANAAAWGLIWQAVDDDQVVTTAETLTARLAEGPTRGFALTKQAIQAAAANSLEQQLSLERALQGEASRTADYGEGVRAFLERRQPVFKGA